MLHLPVTLPKHVHQMAFQLIVYRSSIFLKNPDPSRWSRTDGLNPISRKRLVENQSLPWDWDIEKLETNPFQDFLLLVSSTPKLAGGFKYFLVSPLFGEASILTNIFQIQVETTN